MAKVLPDGAAHKAQASGGPGPLVSVLTTQQRGATPLQSVQCKKTFASPKLRGDLPGMAGAQ